MAKYVCPVAYGKCHLDQFDIFILSIQRYIRYHRYCLCFTSGVFDFLTVAILLCKELSLKQALMKLTKTKSQKENAALQEALIRTSIYQFSAEERKNLIKFM